MKKRVRVIGMLRERKVIGRKLARMIRIGIKKKKKIEIEIKIKKKKEVLQKKLE